MVNQQRQQTSRLITSAGATGTVVPRAFPNSLSSSSSSAYSLPSINCDAAAFANGKQDHHLNFSLIDDIDSHCKKDVEFLAVLPELIKRRVLRIWAEEVKDYRFYGEKSDEDDKDFDTEVCAKRSWFHLLILILAFFEI